MYYAVDIIQYNVFLILIKCIFNSLLMKASSKLLQTV